MIIFLVEQKESVSAKQLLYVACVSSYINTRRETNVKSSVKKRDLCMLPVKMYCPTNFGFRLGDWYALRKMIDGNLDFLILETFFPQVTLRDLLLTNLPTI